jgi:serine/threonine protein kinase
MNAELTGRRLGVYELHERVGAGGMGEVYRAHDTRLQRDVAVKILPEAFAADRHRRARFEREARVLASLNHPNIATIHGFEDAGGDACPVHAVLYQAAG